MLDQFHLLKSIYAKIMYMEQFHFQMIIYMTLWYYQKLSVAIHISKAMKNRQIIIKKYFNDFRSISPSQYYLCKTYCIINKAIIAVPWDYCCALREVPLGPYWGIFMCHSKKWSLQHSPGFPLHPSVRSFLSQPADTASFLPIILLKHDLVIFQGWHTHLLSGPL